MTSTSIIIRMDDHNTRCERTKDVDYAVWASLFLLVSGLLARLIASAMHRAAEVGTEQEEDWEP